MFQEHPNLRCPKSSVETRGPFENHPAVLSTQTLQTQKHRFLRCRWGRLGTADSTLLQASKLFEYWFHDEETSSATGGPGAPASRTRQGGERQVAEMKMVISGVTKGWCLVPK